MSGTTTPIEYAQILLLTGLAAELPGIPAPMTYTPTQGLTLAEPVLLTDFLTTTLKS
jgi:hypothetical protein